MVRMRQIKEDLKKKGQIYYVDQEKKDGGCHMGILWRKRFPCRWNTVMCVIPSPHPYPCQGSRKCHRSQMLLQLIFRPFRLGIWRLFVYWVRARVDQPDNIHMLLVGHNPTFINKKRPSPFHRFPDSSLWEWLVLKVNISVLSDLL